MKIEHKVIEQIKARAKLGEKKYGTTMERNDLNLTEWLQHLQEELMDATIYIEKLKQEVEYQEYSLKSPRYHESEIEGDRNDRTTWENPGGSYWENQLDPDVAEHNHNVEREKQAQEEFAKEEAREERMKIIGQNGNDGLHYSPKKEDNYLEGENQYKRSGTLYPGDIYKYDYERSKKK